VDDLSPAEHLYYIYQLSLSPSQSAQFLATLSSNSLASDDYLRTLTPTGAADRRASVAGRAGSELRTALFQLRVALVEAFLDHDNGDGGHSGGARAAVTTGSPDVHSEPAVHTDSVHSGSGGTSGPAAPPWPEISDIECKLRLARGDRDRSSKPLPEYNGPNSSHEAANRAELAKRRQSGACYACLNSRVQYDLFHLECPQHGRGATHKQRTDKALCVPGAISSKYTSDGPRPGPAPRQPPYASSVGGPGSARRQGCTHAPATAGPGRRKGRSPPGPDPVPLERLRQLQTSGGRQSTNLTRPMRQA
jgi:hypothetical protein